MDKSLKLVKIVLVYIWNINQKILSKGTKSNLSGSRYQSSPCFSSRSFVYFRSAAINKRCFSDSVRGASAGLDLKFDEDVAVVTMNNKDNRFNLQFLKEFNCVLDDVEQWV